MYFNLIRQFASPTLKEVGRAKDWENVYYIVAEKGVPEIPRARDKAHI